MLLLLSLLFCGCSREASEYKAEADREVYGIIDKQWNDDFGPKPDYKLSEQQTEPDEILSEAVEIPSGVMTLTDAVSIAVKTNRQYQTQKEDLYIKALDQTLIEHSYNPNPFGTAGAGYSKTDSGSFVSTDATYGFSQLLETGTQISTSVGLAWVDVLSGDFRSGLKSLFSAAVKKPLLRGSSRKIVLENLTQAQRDTVYQIRTFSRFRKELVVSIINDYYRLLGQLERTNNAMDNFRTLNDLHAKIEKRVLSGRLETHELEEIRQDRLWARDTYIKEKRLYQQMLDDFKIALSISPSEDIQPDRLEFNAVKNNGLPGPSFSDEQAIEAAMMCRLDLMNDSDAIADARRKIAVAKDRLRAELNLTAGAANKADVSALSTESSSVDVGLELDMPLDRKAERNMYRKSLIALQRQRRNLAQSRDNISHAIRQAYRNLTNASDLYRIQQESLSVAQQRYKNTKLLIQYDRSDIRDILDAQKDLFKARNEAADSLVNHTVETLNFYLDTGILDIKPDGMWEKRPLPARAARSVKKRKVIDPEATISNWVRKRKK